MAVSMKMREAERTNKVVIVVIMCGTLMLVAQDQGIGLGKREAHHPEMLSQERQSTAFAKMSDMKKGHESKVSMKELHDAQQLDATAGNNTVIKPGQAKPVVIGNKIDLQPSPEGDLLHVKFRPPEGIDYRVKVDVYLESQSPNCKVFTEWVLVQVVGAAGLLDIMELRMIPWGKAELLQEKGEPTVVVGEGNTTRFEGAAPKYLCEHGPAECEGNALISCIQALYPDINQWFRAVSCILAHSCADGEAPVVDSVAHTGSTAKVPCKGMPVDVAPTCISEFGSGMDVEAVRQCTYTPWGSKLLMDNWHATGALKPPATGFPWVVMDGRHLNLTEALLLGKTVCERYVQKVKPFMNGTVPEPLGCFFFPDEPPIFTTPSVNEAGISVLWVVGGITFAVGVGILAYWKYSTLHSDPEEFE